MINSSLPTPELPLGLALADRPVETGMVISCLPDTGSSQTLISSSIAHQLRCTIVPNSAVRLFTADGNRMSVLRLADLSITNSNGLADLSITNNNNNNLVGIKIRVIVTANLAHPALISWHDMVWLNIINKSFPVTAMHTTSSIEELQSSVISNYPNVLYRLPGRFLFALQHPQKLP